MNRVAAAHAVPRRENDAILALGRRWDLWLIGASLTLLLLGLVMVASSSTSTAARLTGDALYYFWRQGVYVIAGSTLAIGATRLPTRLWERVNVGLLCLGAVLLAMVLVHGLGRSVNGSMRWLRLGPVNLQPSEAVKLFVVFYLAGYLVRRGTEVRSSFAGFLKPILVLGVLALLLIREPDFGAILVIFATALAMLFLAGVPFWTYVGSVAGVVGVLGAGMVAAPYRVQRLMSFINPWADPYGSGFQLTQALIAIGRGGVFGVGLGNSVQKLFYLPEAHTDFLFAVLAEELGLVGTVAVLLLFGLVVWRGFEIARAAMAREKAFAAYTAYGIALLIGLQAFINIGVNMGVLPTKGLTLPLMSYGGSSIMMNCLSIGILLRIDHETRTGA